MTLTWRWAFDSCPHPLFQRLPVRAQTLDVREYTVCKQAVAACRHRNDSYKSTR